MTRYIVSLPYELKRTLEQAAEKQGCSEADVARAALCQHLKEYLYADLPKADTTNVPFTEAKTSKNIIVTE